MGLDMKQYSGRRFIKVDDVRAAPITDVIAGVTEGSFDKPDMVLESGDTLSLNKTNVATLRRAFGDDSDAWVGEHVELYLGKIKYQGSAKDAVLVKAALAPAGAGDQSDEIPF